MRLVTWNFGRLAPESAEAREIVSRIAALEPDIVCATEAHEGSLARLSGGQVIADAGAAMQGDAATARKVLLWSRTAWDDVRTWAELSALGGAVSGVTSTPLGRVRVVGVCAPWHLAWPQEAEVRPPEWDLNIGFVDRLKPQLEALEPAPPVIVAGRFNQYLPLTRGSWNAHHALTAALSRFSVATRGDIKPVGEPALDHVALPSQLRADWVGSVDRFGADGEALAEDFGLCVTLAAGGVQIFD